MNYKIVPIDFEYNTTTEKTLNLVCASFEVEGKLFEYWLYKDLGAYSKLKNHILKLRNEGFIFVAFNVVAEGQSFISLGIHPAKCKWIDLQAEWKMLCNHNHKFMYGKQLLKGKEVITSPPKYGTEKTVNNSRPPQNMAGMVYKLLNVKIDTEHKDKIRDLIISNDSEKIIANKKAIMDYCTSDIKYLSKCWGIIKTEYHNYFKYSYKYSKKQMEDLGLTYKDNPSNKITLKEVLYRGETVARTALMQSIGYPVNVEKAKNFAKNVPIILKEVQEDINSQFPEMKIFVWNKRENRYSLYQKELKQWAVDTYGDKWLKTKTDNPSLSLDAFSKQFSYRHDYPRNNLGAQMLRYLKLQQSLNGFRPKSKFTKNRDTFFTFVGSDSRVRCYLNPYGAQSGRYQPKATGYLMLKPAWVRSLIEAPKGRAIIGMDYSSQEFLVSALLSNDKNMIEAYRSGDVYLYFAKLAGAVPWEGARKDYAFERDVFKSTVLGISYLMGHESLALKLTEDTGKLHTSEDSKSLISKFNKAFSDYITYTDSVYFYYTIRKFMKLADGFLMFGDNQNRRSVCNVPSQGMGSCILRKAIQLAQDAGLMVIMPLHDALYIECDSDKVKESVLLLRDCMVKAFGFYFEQSKLAEELIRVEADVWSQDFKDEIVNYSIEDVEVKQQKTYVDGRAKKEYERFSKYFTV